MSISCRPLVAIAITLLCAVAQAQSLPGRYQVDGRNVDGGTYGGTLTISADGPVFRLVFSDGQSQRGMGIQRGQQLVAAFGPDSCIVAAMELAADGSLQGAWGQAQRSALGTETLRRQAGAAGQVDGTYAATGRTPTGEGYEGVTTIVPRGQAFHVTFKDSGTPQTGVAVRQDNVLGVAYGGPDCVVSVYTLGADGKLTGRWADPGDTRLGQETVRRQR